jgi:hypothetical protein
MTRAMKQAFAQDETDFGGGEQVDIWEQLISFKNNRCKGRLVVGCTCEENRMPFLDRKHRLCIGYVNNNSSTSRIGT